MVELPHCETRAQLIFESLQPPIELRCGWIDRVGGATVGRYATYSLTVTAKRIRHAACFFDSRAEEILNMQTVSITIDSADRIAFERIYWKCVKEARPKQPGELVLSFDLPAAQFVARSTVYRGVSAWLLDNYLSGALQDEGMAFDVG
ncbi:hypothetical protein [Paraburkholderia caffeinilytica]|uniref:Polyketide cyclase n=1 Tax=Paraburkholderia caffeinilytica TaxID=1761016 RepID=A0ABQ1LJ77_9BURK|nr:hypothetical protein [Paraburkholderia caffeinilytica]GGC24473.1 hypothetical protein GCM10011400_08560 [Paraburkholderia caffeinilytica]